MLNPDYRPTTDDDVNIFKQKQNLMHDVFDKTSRTDQGRQLVKEI